MLVYQPDFWPPARNTLLRVSETCPGLSLSLNENATKSGWLLRIATFSRYRSWLLMTASAFWSRALWCPACAMIAVATVPWARLKSANLV
jgi:hypothetical protein